MKKLLNSKLMLIPIGMLMVWVWYSMMRNGIRENDEKCLMKHMRIKGLITYQSDHNSYHYITVSNIEKNLRTSIIKTEYIKGFEDGYLYKIGDSIIKEAGSNEFTIKRGSNIAVHIINCDD